MAKKVLNLRSSEQGKKPTQEQIEYGQIAVNYNENNERIFIKNSTNNIIDFIPTHEVDKHIQDNVKLSSGYTESSLSNEELEPKPNDSLDTAVGKLHKSIKDNEEVISSAIDKIRNSTGFDENLGFSSTNELISGTTSLKDAIEKVADKANSGVDTSTLATKEELQSGLEAKQDKGNYITVETADGKYATITNLNSKLDTDTYNVDKATFALKTEIPDVSNFITNSVDNLVNYYKKNEIDDKISAITTINFEVVGELPDSGEANKIYLVPNVEQQEQNVKDEYIWIDNKWEIIGSTKIDLSPYITVDVSNLTNYYTKTQSDEKYQTKGNYALKSEIPSVSLSSGYTESSLSNEELEPKANETFEVAIGKLHKAIKDNEIVDSTAFDKIKNSCGFDVNGNYKPTNELIAGATSLTEAIDIIANKLSTLI